MCVTLIQIGDEVGFIFPDGILERYNLKTGDELELIVTDYGFELIPIRKASESCSK
ncbi:bifunctional DNA-binding transcriptional regulator/antitoxin component of YhaV-PrlF toxin-antitoxin module [Phyllobacterium sp. P30BS-XVII]|nr:bifunctional DNA-binding transcriptional regulator/antitoxin component of YhaV-PrlF toxin-antitoxin module [Phyllobacterium sp. P30BS-XVII]